VLKRKAAASYLAGYFSCPWPKIIIVSCIVVVHTYNHRTQETGAGRSQVQGQAGLYSETLSLNKWINKYPVISSPSPCIAILTYCFIAAVLRRSIRGVLSVCLFWWDWGLNSGLKLAKQVLYSSYCLVTLEMGPLKLFVWAGLEPQSSWSLLSTSPCPLPTPTPTQ
jgi:hypothetical protein